MDIRPVGRVHQPDHGIINATFKDHDLAQLRLCAVRQPFDRWDRRCHAFVLAEEDPDIALLFANRVVADLDLAGAGLLLFDDGGDRGASPGGIEAPAVIGTGHFLAIEGTDAERIATVRTDIAQGECLSAPVATEQDRLAQHCLGFEPAGREHLAAGGQIPDVAQRRVVR